MVFCNMKLSIQMKSKNIYHNRDKNAVQNMISIIEELKKSGKRPLCFTRGNMAF